ncbi:MAG: DNA polymerase III subunit gamma/tau [Myxococcota bacterium]|nr:DNA polymerase III subunit gamma/tau [Myxococcota bacterium]
MSYLVLARKWRPNAFAEVVGQSHVVKTLAGAIEVDRVAHAFVFSGVRGVGKTSLARILAKSLNCTDGPTIDPCGSCTSCRTIAAGTAVDVIEIDGASNNSVDDIRELRETVPYRPVIGKYKVYVIDEVHMLSTSAFNALLKTLEEPPAHVKFIFATTEAHKIPVTILSRCQRYDFRRIPTSAIVDRIRSILDDEKIAADENALALIGREAEGSMRDALSILDQVLASQEKDITADAVADLLGVVDGQVLYDISRAVLKGASSSVIEIIRTVDDQGYDIPTFAKSLLEHFRNLVVAGVCQDNPSVVDLPDVEKEELFELAGTVSVHTLHRLFKHFSEAFEAIARSSHPRILLETSLVRIADLGDLVPAADLVRKLEALVARLGGHGSSGPQHSPPPVGTGPQGQGSKGLSRTQASPMASSQPPPALSSEGRPSGQPAGAADPPPRAGDARHAIPRAKNDWEAEIEALKREKPTIGSLLECGVPQPSEDGAGLTISYAQEYRAIADLAIDRQREIERILSERLGTNVKVHISTDKATEIPLVTRRRLERDEERRRREDDARLHPLVQRAQAEFGASVTQVTLSSDGPNLEQ